MAAASFRVLCKRASSLLAQIRNREEDCDDQSREELEVVRVELEPEDEHHDRIVYNAAKDDEQEPYRKVAALAENRITQNLADDDGS